MAVNVEQFAPDFALRDMADVKALELVGKDREVQVGVIDIRTLYIESDGRPTAPSEAVARLLMEQGPGTAADVASALELSGPAVRRHLDALIADGEAEPRAGSRRARRGRGRPAKHYLLTDAGRPAGRRSPSGWILIGPRRQPDSTTSPSACPTTTQSTSWPRTWTASASRMEAFTRGASAPPSRSARWVRAGCVVYRVSSTSAIFSTTTSGR
jgi:hypothetical protein